MAYARSQDVLILSLADGSFHVVSNISRDPSLISATAEIGLTSAAVSATARANFVKVEEEPMKKLDVNTIHGMSPYDGDSFYLWVHE